MTDGAIDVQAIRERAEQFQQHAISRLATDVLALCDEIERLQADRDAYMAVYNLTSSERDEARAALAEVLAALREKDAGHALQFLNVRSFENAEKPPSEKHFPHARRLYDALLRATEALAPERAGTEELGGT